VYIRQKENWCRPTASLFENCAKGDHLEDLLVFGRVIGNRLLIPVAARSKASVCGHSPLLRLCFRIPLGAWMLVCCECYVLSGRGLCDGFITRPEEPYRLWRVVVCDQETSKNEEAKACYWAVKIQPQWVVTPGKQTKNRK
jgi:hypothetical protein